MTNAGQDRSRSRDDGNRAPGPLLHLVPHPSTRYYPLLDYVSQRWPEILAAHGIEVDSGVACPCPSPTCGGYDRFMFRVERTGDYATRRYVYFCRGGGEGNSHGGTGLDLLVHCGVAPNIATAADLVSAYVGIGATGCTVGDEPLRHTAATTYPPGVEVRFEYTREDGSPHMVVKRRDPVDPSGSKSIFQFAYNADGAEVPIRSLLDAGIGFEYYPYRLHEWARSDIVGRGDNIVYVVEGEKCADCLWAYDLRATTSPGGGASWKSDVNRHFAGYDVIVIPDNDETGRRRAQCTRDELLPVAASVRVIDLPGFSSDGTGEDIVDWLDNRENTLELFFTLTTGAPPADDWSFRLCLNKDGSPISNSSNAGIVLRHAPEWAGVFRYDLTRSKVVVAKPIPGTEDDDPSKVFRPGTICDEDITAANRWMQGNRFPRFSRKEMGYTIREAAKSCWSFNPVTEYLRSLEWDGIQRVSNFFSTYIGATPDEGLETEYYQAAASSFFISAVARAFNPGNQVDTMIVLDSVQGTGKTSLFRHLGGDWYSSGLPADVRSKDAADFVRGKWIVDLAEMRQLKGSSAEDLKDFITRRKDDYRRAYTEDEVSVDRMCVFVGATNRTSYLVDHSGNRRFLPISVGRASDLTSVERDRDQLWAEAVRRYDAGEHWLLPEHLAETVETAQRRRLVEDVLETKVQEYVDEQMYDLETHEPKPQKFADIVVVVTGEPHSKCTRAMQHRIRDLLSQIGCTKANRRYKGYFRWIPPPYNPPED